MCLSSTLHTDHSKQLDIGLYFYGSVELVGILGMGGKIGHIHFGS